MIVGDASQFPLQTAWPVPGEQTFRTILEKRAAIDADHKFCVWDSGALTIGALHEASNRLANALLTLGLRKGDVVALMLDQHAAHFIALYALAKVGLVRTSVNVNAKGDYLALLFADARPRAIIAESGYRGVLEPVLASNPTEHVLWSNDLERLIDQGEARAPATTVFPDDVLAINYTSGTTGAPKKFTRTDRVMQIGSLGCLLIGDMVPGDVLLFWEPLYHGAGNQTALAASMEKVTLAMMPRFSASQFWDYARKFGATKIHYIGGILPILLKQPPRSDDREHRVEIAWGAGAPADTCAEFERRFNVRVHEGYGLSEVANFVCINRDGPVGSIGRVLPFFDVRLIDGEERDVPTGATGQIVVRGKRPENTSRSLNQVRTTTRDGWIQTGDLGRADERGFLYFAGRKSDSLRRRGENVSAWEVERIIVQHEAVEECALVGVPSGLGDDDLKVFIKRASRATLDPLALVKWCEDRMPYFQVPRYVAFIDDLPKTPTQRVKKGELSKATDDCWDLQKSGYVLRR
jgi:crotonobetaine/carnitine-CoA ligase